MAPRISARIQAFVTMGRRRVPFTVDSLSVTGARLVGPLALVRGQRVDITLELEGEIVEVGGEVVRVDTPDLLADQIAVRFIDLSPRSRLAIGAVLARRLDFDDDETVVVNDIVTDNVVKRDDDEERVTGPLPKTRPP